MKQLACKRQSVVQSAAQHHHNPELQNPVSRSKGQHSAYKPQAVGVEVWAPHPARFGHPAPLEQKQFKKQPVGGACRMPPAHSTTAGCGTPTCFPHAAGVGPQRLPVEAFAPCRVCCPLCAAAEHVALCRQAGKQADRQTGTHAGRQRCSVVENTQPQDKWVGTGMAWSETENGLEPRS